MSESMCPKCKGDGIIGAGERPWEKAGATSTCDMCGGTGVVDGTPTEPVDQPANEPVEPVADVLPEEPKAPADEQPTAPVINVGDRCITSDGFYGTQHQNDDGSFTCVANDPQ